MLPSSPAVSAFADSAGHTFHILHLSTRRRPYSCQIFYNRKGESDPFELRSLVCYLIRCKCIGRVKELVCYCGLRSINTSPSISDDYGMCSVSTIDSLLSQLLLDAEFQKSLNLGTVEEPQVPK